MKVFVMTLLSIATWITNCAFATPFAKSKKVEDLKITPETEVVFAITEVHIQGSSNNKNTFWDRVFSVRDNLESNPGYLGSSIRREVLGSRAWTMTVWKDTESLEAFVYSREHERAMKEGAPAVQKALFYRSKKKWKDLPIPWKEAEALILEDGREE